MSGPVLHLREYPSGNVLVQFHCPGCRHLHQITVVQGNMKGPVWDWNQDMERTTFAPSILVRGGEGEANCHSFVRNGHIEYLSDCGHDHASKTVPLLPVEAWPSELQAYKL